MLHWTILNAVDVFQGIEQPIEYQEIVQSGRTLMVQPRGDGTGVLIRLISPLAADYLRTEWQPGAVVNLFSSPN